MIRDEIKVGVKNLAINEREHALKEHGEFNSDAEMYAVTLEEVEEAEDEYQKMRWKLQNIWDSVKGNRPIATEAERLKVYAINCACECIQVAAMCDKLLTVKND